MRQERNVHKLETFKSKGYIALGANVASAVGPPAVTFANAFMRLRDADLRINRISRFYRTPCMPAGAGPDYVNAVAEIETALPALAVLERLHRVEAMFGRVRTVRWGARTLDLDLLDLGGAIHPDRATQDAWRGLPPDQQARRVPPTLILPHPRLQERAFVLVPLAEIAPDWRHPILARTARDLLDALPEGEKMPISPVSGPWSSLSALVNGLDTQ